MRITLIIVAFMSFISLKAQTYFPVSSMNYVPQATFYHSNSLNDSNNLRKKWSVNTYTGIGAGFAFFNGGGTAFFPAQIGLQINRRLSNNLYAFAGVSAAPVYFNFNRSFSSADPNKNYMGVPAFNQNGLGIYSGIQAGLMYVNDEKTFSISGSIGISSNSYPFYTPSRVNAQKQPSLTGNRQ